MFLTNIIFPYLYIIYIMFAVFLRVFGDTSVD